MGGILQTIHLNLLEHTFYITTFELLNWVILADQFVSIFLNTKVDIFTPVITLLYFITTHRFGTHTQHNTTDFGT
jgi:hypothetical protein